MAEDEEAPTPTMQNNWVEDGKEAHDEEALKKQYEAMYGRYYEEESSWCSCKGLFKLLLLMVIAAVALIGLFAYSNPDWEGWTVLAPVFPENASYIDMITHGYDHFTSESTWSTFGEYLITNTSIAMDVRGAYNDFQNSSIGDVGGTVVDWMMDTWENMDIMNSTLFTTIEDAINSGIDSVNGTVQDSMKTGKLMADNTTMVTKFLSDTWNDINTMVSDYSGQGKDIWQTIEELGRNLTELAHSKFNDTMDMVQG